jgi:hypothetical protein
VRYQAGSSLNVAIASSFEAPTNTMHGHSSGFTASIVASLSMTFNRWVSAGPAGWIPSENNCSRFRILDSSGFRSCQLVELAGDFGIPHINDVELEPGSVIEFKTTAT